MKEIHVVGAIIIKNKQILCAQRGNEKALPNLWEFPGGKIEQDETPQEALIRELQEELKIEVEVEREAFETTVYTYDFGRVHLTTFICNLIEGKPQLTEHHQIKWLYPHELDQVKWAPADIPAVEKLMIGRVEQ
ncbi:(deoxy)nucleoside triphosphate pyrophosphohydrolase [Alkalibacterium sp. MB6]|uniref:(deoxy)nucleoside triphosphate pyrophosphohydrolase n=1 Tax=Alkalibacterium sp. MB6 TaxID=2081965 RepID=UPI00137B432F|nr:(deoxy)nucleoside triphosphate pyrophosphohydrolase [Alkalibacterium sp. MB6]